MKRIPRQAGGGFAVGGSQSIVMTLVSDPGDGEGDAAAVDVLNGHSGLPVGESDGQAVAEGVGAAVAEGEADGAIVGDAVACEVETGTAMPL